MSGERVGPGLIVNADDLAIHPSINAGILSAYRSGIVSSATMLMTTPYVDATVRDAVRGGNLPVGIHLSLTLGTSVAGRRKVPDLVDERNNFTWSSRRLLLCSFGDGKRQHLLSQIRQEFEAQLALAHDHGLRLTHADSHQHVHMNPAIFSLVEELLPRFGVQRLRYSHESLPPKAAVGVLKQGKPVNLAKIAWLRWLSRRVEPRLVTTDGFFGVAFSGIVTKRVLHAVVMDLPGARSLEICIHPGFPAPVDAAIYPIASVNDFISSPARRAEHDILVDPAIVELVRQRGIALRGFDGREKG